MKTWKRSRMVVMLAAVTLCAAGGCKKKVPETEGYLTIRDGGREWRFAPVEGESRINLARMTGQGEDAGGTPDILRLSRFWIATKPVTEGDFAAWTGGTVREGRSAEQPVAEIEWEEALDCCAKFTDRYAGQLPDHVFASLPTMLEWAHAVEVLDHPDWLDAEVGTFLFTRNQYGGFLCAPVGDSDGMPISVPKRGKRVFAGLRLVLLDITDGTTEVNGETIDDSMVSRGDILTESGLLPQAKAQLERVLAKGNLSEEERERAETALAFAREDHGAGFEDWDGLVVLAAQAAKEKGFEPEPFTEVWRTLGMLAEMENKEAVKAYAVKGIAGGWVSIGKLPDDVRSEQPLGESNDIVILADGDIETREFATGPEHVVQVLRCDFTGDGVVDLVVETFGAVGSDGYWYDFFEGRPDGSHVLRESLQTVGLCAIPRTGGGACGFLDISKDGNPVLEVALLTFRDGEATYEPLVGPTVMVDMFPDRIYFAAPFIGPGFGLGWKALEGRGIWYRPLFWPWKQGKVQGQEETPTMTRGEGGNGKG